MTDANPTDLFSGTKEVTESHRFDESKLAAWMEANVEGYKGPLEVRQFKGGQSNPTYQLITPTKKYVMRRKPPGKLLPSAHAVDREYRVIAALHPLGFPVAKPYGLCEDESVTGTMFYIMDMVEGRILWDATLPDYTPEQRAAIYDAKVSTFAALHNVDWQKAGLEGFGKEGDYIARQIHRWTKQYQMSETTKIPEMDKLIEWLPEEHSAGRDHHNRPRRLSHRQHGASPDRATRARRARLGVVHPRRSAGRFHLPSHVVGDALVRPTTAEHRRRRRHARLWHPEQGSVRRPLLRTHRPRAACPRWTSISRTTPSASPAFFKALSAASATARHRTPPPPRTKAVSRRLRSSPMRAPSVPGWPEALSDQSEGPF